MNLRLNACLSRAAELAAATCTVELESSFHPLAPFIPPPVLLSQERTRLEEATAKDLQVGALFLLKPLLPTNYLSFDRSSYKSMENNSRLCLGKWL